MYCYIFNLINLKKYICKNNIFHFHYGVGATNNPAHAPIQTPWATLQAIAAKGAPRPPVTVPEKVKRNS